MALLQQVIRVARRAMSNGRPKLQPQGAGGRALAVGNDAERAPLTEHTRGTKEGPRRRQFTGLTQTHIKQIPLMVERTIEVDPFAIDCDERLIDMSPPAPVAVAVLA
jgi:hypothetical protein